MMPRFSIEEYASSRFMSVWAAAKITPYSALKESEAERHEPHHHSGVPQQIETHPQHAVDGGL